MTSKYLRLFVLQSRKIWVRVVGFAVLAVLTAIIAQAVSGYLPDEWVRRLGAQSVGDVLNILATSMLAVTTFSLSISVSAFAAAANSATPRATALLQEDHTAQNVLAIFLGAFVFGLVGIIALNAGYYSESGKLVLFAATVLVIVLVTLALLRWITHLTVFGRIGDTLDRVEVAASNALDQRVKNPWLGGRAPDYDVPEGASEIRAGFTGYVQHIDMQALSNCAKALDALVWVHALPGSFVHPTTILLSVDHLSPSEAQIKKMRQTFTCGKERNFDQDPRFGLIVLAEIASRALSPGVNDPGTAIDVLGRLVRILTPWRKDVEPKAEFPNIFVPSLTVEDLFSDAFRPIARDGATVIEVQLRLQRALFALSALDPDTFDHPACDMSREAIERAMQGNMMPDDLVRLRRAAQDLKRAE